MLTILNELGLNIVNTIKSAYSKAIKAAEKIVSDNASFLKSDFNPEVNGINKKLPSIY